MHDHVNVSGLCLLHLLITTFITGANIHQQRDGPEPPNAHLVGFSLADLIHDRAQVRLIDRRGTSW